MQALCNHANFILAFMHLLENFLGLPSGSAVKKNLPAMQKMRQEPKVISVGQEDPLGKEIATPL